jgi:hypothetical protein
MCLPICTYVSTCLCSVRQKEFHYILYGDVTKLILHEHILILDRKRIISASHENLQSAIMRSCRTQLLNIYWTEDFFEQTF